MINQLYKKLYNFPNPIMQAPFRRVLYSLTGDDSAPVYFKINPSNGALSTLASVNSDDKTQYRVSISML